MPRPCRGQAPASRRQHRGRPTHLVRRPTGADLRLRSGGSAGSSTRPGRPAPGGQASGSACIVWVDDPGAVVSTQGSSAVPDPSAMTTSSTSYHRRCRRRCARTPRRAWHAVTQEGQWSHERDKARRSRRRRFASVPPPPPAAQRRDQPFCWCCGRTFAEESAVTRLGDRPEVGVCARCAPRRCTGVPGSAADVDGAPRVPWCAGGWVRLEGGSCGPASTTGRWLGRC